MQNIYALLALLAIGLTPAACGSPSSACSGACGGGTTSTETTTTATMTITSTGAPLGGPCVSDEDCAPDESITNDCGTISCVAGTCQEGVAPDGTICGTTALPIDGGLSKCAGTCSAGSCKLQTFACNPSGTMCGCSGP